MQLTLMLLLAGLAADPRGFVYWEKGVPGGPAKFANHSLSVSHRDKDGSAEVHENQTDILVVQSGEAKLTIGGTLLNRTETGPGEFRGTAIEGGVTKMLKAGDVVHIPSKMPHQFFVEPGKQISYFVVKIDNP